MYGPLWRRSVRGAAKATSADHCRDCATIASRQEAQTSLAFEPFETRVGGRLDAVRAEPAAARNTGSHVTRAGSRFLSPVFAAFGLVLVAACANASNVMLARANARHREIGIRLSIGASRGRVVRQLVTEGLPHRRPALRAAGSPRSARFFGSACLPSSSRCCPPTSRDCAPIGAARLRYLASSFASVVAGRPPSSSLWFRRSKPTRLTLTDALRGQAVASSAARRCANSLEHRARLLYRSCSSSLPRHCVRNGVAIRATDLGMATDHVVSVRPGQGEKTLLARTHAALTADPRLGQVAVVSRSPPLRRDHPSMPLRQPTGIVLSAYTFVSPEYFQILSIPIVHGRGFSSEESRTEAPVAIISAAGAKTLWPGEEPVGTDDQALHRTANGASDCRYRAGDSPRRRRRSQMRSPSPSSASPRMS